MKLCKSNPDYNPITLKPRTEEDRELFWKFRSEDIAVIFRYYLVASTLMLITGVFQIL